MERKINKRLEILKNIQSGIYSLQEINSLFSMYHPRYVSQMIKEMLDYGILKKIGTKRYAYGTLQNIDMKTLSNQIDKESYVSLYSVLSGIVFKQHSQQIFAITQKKQSKKITLDNSLMLGNKAYFSFYSSKIPQTFGIIISNNIRIAEPERAFLDLLYLAYLGKIHLNKEMYLNLLDEQKIKEYLKYYPRFLTPFYFKIKKYAKSL